MQISTILDKIDENQLRVPAFQREYVWKREDVKQLVDSLIKDYPTGTMLTWETNKPPELKGDQKYTENQGAIKILLDGQQRITTLYMLSRGTVPPYYTQEDIKNDVRGLYVNLETCELSYYQRIRMENDPRWCDVSDILQKQVRAKHVVKKLEEQGVEVSVELDDQIDENTQRVLKILDRDFPEQIVPIHATVQEAIEIFYKVNAGGVALTEAELALAQISGYWPEAREEFKAKLVELEEGGFVFRLDFIVYCLLGCLYHQGSDMRKLHSPEENDQRIRETWAQLRDGTLDYVCNLLKTRAFVDHTSEINSVFALIPMIVHSYDHDQALTDAQIRRMIKWFYYSQIRQRYASQTTTKLDADLKVVAEAELPFDRMLGVIEESHRLEIRPDEFMYRGVLHPLFSMMRWLLKSRGAVCLTTGVGLQMNMGAKYQLERDHIFPYGELKKIGYSSSDGHKYQLAQELTNRAILTAAANRSKAAMLPSVYLAEVVERFPDALASQCIPDDPELWELDRYEEFLAERRKQLAVEMNAYLQGITETSEVSAPVSLAERIAAGESYELELKSSLRWDYKQGIQNKKLEDVVVKTIAAFANADGGTLLIGVNDDGEALGLENDYAALRGDKDKFELHLRNLLGKHVDVGQVARTVSVSFPVVDGEEICMVEVNLASSAWFLEVGEDGGPKSEKLYVRNGNSSAEIPPSEIAGYVAERFDGA